jgi:hypothetical protein
MLINSVLLESADTAGVPSDEPVQTIPLKVGKYLFRREIFWNFGIGASRDNFISRQRDVAGRPKATGNVVRKQTESCLEDSPEKAGAAAQQTAQEAAEDIPAEHTAEGAAPDHRPAEAAFAAHVRVGHHVTDRPDNVEAAADEAVVARVREPGDHVAELVVSGDDAALVTEEPAFTLHEAPDETAEQPAVNATEEAADRVTAGGVSRNHACCAEAQTEREAGCAYPPNRRWQLVLPCIPSLPFLLLAACASATGPMAEVEGSVLDNSTFRVPKPLSARSTADGFFRQKQNRRPPAGWPAVLGSLHCTALHCTAQAGHRTG